MTKEVQMTNDGFQIPLSELSFGVRASLFFRHYDFVIRYFLLVFLFLHLSASAAETNSLVWHKATGRVDADVHDMALWPLLEKIAEQADWKIFVEPGAQRTASATFENVSSGAALKMLLGDLNFALIPQSNSPPQLYIFRTTMQNATRLVKTGKARHVPNELMIRVKPGTDVEALARMLGAKITGHLDKYGIYRLQFADAAATDAALSQLQNDSDVLGMDYNYIYDSEPSAQMVPSSPLGAISLALNPPGSSGHVIVGLVDTPVQTLDGSLEQFLLKQISVTGDAYATGADPTHGTAMAETILRAIAQQSPNTSAQILPVNVYDSGETTTSWNVALGIQAAVNAGATVINLSLGSSGDSTVLDVLIQQAIGDGIVFFGAAGNSPVNTPSYPAAVQGVHSVTALGAPGQLASYANFWTGDELALPGGNFINFGNQAYVVQGTSVATAYATGIFTGTLSAHPTLTGTQIFSAMQQKYVVPWK